MKNFNINNLVVCENGVNTHTHTHTQLKSCACVRYSVDYLCANNVGIKIKKTVWAVLAYAVCFFIKSYSSFGKGVAFLFLFVVAVGNCVFKLLLLPTVACSPLCVLGGGLFSIRWSRIIFRYKTRVFVLLNTFFLYHAEQKIFDFLYRSTRNILSKGKIKGTHPTSVILNEFFLEKFVSKDTDFKQSLKLFQKKYHSSIQLQKTFTRFLKSLKMRFLLQEKILKLNINN